MTHKRKGGVRPGAGRPPGTPNTALQAEKRELRDIARSYTDMALQALVEVAGQREVPNARVSAAKELLDRGWGKPIQATETPPSPPGDDAKLINGVAVLPPLMAPFKRQDVN